MPLGTLGKYERLDVLGHGVSGIVYLAQDTLLHRQVALKEVDVQAGEARRFLEEARVMDRLRHPNIVRVHSVDRIDGKIVIDMEYVRGQNLQNLLRAEGPLPLDRALDIGAQILDGLEYAHTMQTVHRDIKPANILISRDGAVKLADFGLAEILATNAYAGGAGTYAYMAPEDFAEEDRSDHQSDIWAVGVTLYEILTLNRPFQVMRVKDPFSWKRAVENDLPALLSDQLDDVPDALQAVLDRALCRNKRDRYQTAGEFREDILRVQAGQTLPTETLRVAEKMARRRQAMASEDSSSEESYRSENSGSSRRDPEPYSGPGVVVADINVPEYTPGVAVVQPDVMPSEPASKRSLRMPFTRKKAETRLIVEPEWVDFGAVRKGELRTAKVQVRTQGVEGNIHGRVQHNPGWLTVHPTAFDKSKQQITLTAHTARTWETGEFREVVRVETDAGEAEIPVRLMVLKPRPTFRDIALWYVPLIAASLLPVVTLAIGSSGSAYHLAPLVPTAGVTSGLLAVMLLLICVAVETGISEKIACGVLMAAMSFIVGAALSRPVYSAQGSVGLQYALVTGALIAGFLLLQLLYLRKWKFWVCVLLGLSLLVSSAFFRVLGS